MGFYRPVGPCQGPRFDPPDIAHTTAPSGYRGPPDAFPHIFLVTSALDLASWTPSRYETANFLFTTATRSGPLPE